MHNRRDIGQTSMQQHTDINQSSVGFVFFLKIKALTYLHLPFNLHALRGLGLADSTPDAVVLLQYPAS